MTNKQKAIEQYFLALGWEKREKILTSDDNFDEGRIIDRITRWFNPDGLHMGRDLPDLIDHFPSFIKWVIQKMEGEGFSLYMSPNALAWREDDAPFGCRHSHQDIKDNEITLAAVIAATRVWESKNADK